MHECGHDTHTSMILGSTKILKANENNQLFMIGIQNLNSLN